MSWVFNFKIISLTCLILLTLLFIASLCLRYENYELCSAYGLYTPAITWIVFCTLLTVIIFITVGVLLWVYKLPTNKKRKGTQVLDNNVSTVNIYIPLDIEME